MIQNRNKIGESSMISTESLFREVSSSQPMLFQQAAQPILKNTFQLNCRAITLILTQNYILSCEAHQSRPSHFCQIDFKVKFDVLRKAWIDDKTPGTASGICLERENCPQKLEFMSDSSIVVDIWVKELEKKINQRNFHKLFKAKKKIGKGAFATVYLAEKLVDGKMVAVKAFSKQKQYSGDKGRQSLENEIKIMRSLDHKNVMKLESIYETENSIYLILEYLEGVQLNDEIKNNRNFTEFEVKSIIRNLLKGLEHLSSKNVIHRDLKPENIMFRTKDSTDLAICDFGLATFADEEKYLFVRCGTPGFVAPEIINIKDMSVKSSTISDVFSVGLIMHYLLFHRSIFSGKKYAEILQQNRACDFDFSGPQYRQMSRQSYDLLVKLLEKKPELRITAANALNHPYLDEIMDSQMDIEEGMEDENKENVNNKHRLFHEKSNQLASVETPSTVYSVFGERRKFEGFSGKQAFSHGSFYGKKTEFQANKQNGRPKKAPLFQ